MKYYVIDLFEGTIDETKNPQEALKIVNNLLKQEPEEVETDIENNQVRIIRGEDVYIELDKTIKARFLNKEI